MCRCVTPYIRAFNVNFYCTARLFSSIVHCLCDPLYDSASLLFTKIFVNRVDNAQVGSCNFSNLNTTGEACRGGYKIPRRRAPTYDFVKFSEKLHEIEKMLGRGGAEAPPPLGSATGLWEQIAAIFLLSMRAQDSTWPLDTLLSF